MSSKPCKKNEIWGGRALKESKRGQNAQNREETSPAPNTPKCLAARWRIYIYIYIYIAIAIKSLLRNGPKWGKLCVPSFVQKSDFCDFSKDILHFCAPEEDAR